MTNRIRSTVGPMLLATFGLFASGLGCPTEVTPPDEVGDTDDGDDDPGDGDGDGDAGDGDGDGCVGQDGCFACEPTNSAEFLNACSDASCEPFDNSQARLP